MPDEPTPPRKIYGLKPREFERVNAPTTPPPGGDSTGSSATPSDAAAPPDARTLARIATGNQPLLSANAPANRPNDVHALLAGNHASAEAAGLNALAPQSRRRSKRRRDYWLLLFAGNGFILGIYLVQIVIGYQVHCLAGKIPFEFLKLLVWAATNPAFFAIPSLGILFYSAALTWVMFHVMEDY
jgi:hypothetical protein